MLHAHPVAIPVDRHMKVHSTPQFRFPTRQKSFSSPCASLTRERTNPAPVTCQCVEVVPLLNRDPRHEHKETTRAGEGEKLVGIEYEGEVLVKIQQKA